MCHEAHLPWLRDDAAVEQKRSKGSADVMAVYRKPIAPPRATFERRVCVLSPREHGNLGTIVRTAAAFGVTDVVTVGGIDVWSPHVVRASIGASFAMHVAGIDDLDDLPPGPHEATTWYLDGAGSRTVGEVGPLREPWTLVVGPEWPGLDPSVVDTARSIRIDHGRDVESLNVAVAVGIALHALVVHPGSTDGTGTGAAVPTR